MTNGAWPSGSPRILFRIGGTVVAIAGLFTFAMLVVESIGPAFLNDPSTWAVEATLVIAAMSVVLLTADVVLPIPASVVLVANGAVFGVAVGSVVSTVGLTMSALFGYALGRRGAAITERLIGPASMHWLAGCAERHGVWVVGATRAVPLAAEITSLGAGASAMRRGPFVVAVIIGAAASSIPLALLGAGAPGVDAETVVAGAAIVTGLALWLGARSLVARRLSAPRREFDGEIEVAAA